MGGFKNPKIKDDYPTREDAIAKTYEMTSDAVKSLPEDMHPEIKSAVVKSLVQVTEQSIEVIKNSEAWD